MKKVSLNVLKTFFNSKKNIRIVLTILTIITAYYLIITGGYLMFLLPLIFMWAAGSDRVKFYNVSSSRLIRRTDISYFTTGDILDSIKLLLIIAVLIFVITRLAKIEKKLP